MLSRASGTTYWAGKAVSIYDKDYTPPATGEYRQRSGKNGEVTTREHNSITKKVSKNQFNVANQCTPALP
jgi:hypothetical protein